MCIIVYTELCDVSVLLCTAVTKLICYWWCLRLRQSWGDELICTTFNYEMILDYTIFNILLISFSIYRYDINFWLVDIDCSAKHVLNKI